MKRTTIRLLLSLAVVLLATRYEAFAQSPNPSASVQPRAEQSLQELVNEVRQLRTEVRRVGLAAYKGQVLVERLRLQQAEVARLSRELSETRERVEEARAIQDKLKESIKLEDKQVENGLKSPKELSEMKAELETSKQSEQRSILRESQLTSDLQEARAKLAEVEQQLNTIDHEVMNK